MPNIQYFIHIHSGITTKPPPYLSLTPTSPTNGPYSNPGHLTVKLTEWGFELNPYDACIANKTIDGKQCTIMWHVDDLKIYHVDSKVIESIIKLLDEEFGIYAPLIATQGKIHDYVGIVIDYTTQGKVVFTMFDYIDNVLNDLLEVFSGTELTPACNHLFNKNGNQTKVIPEEQENFYHHVSKLLYLSYCSCYDIQTAVSYLCNRVQNPYIDDMNKLIWTMKHL